MLLDALVGGVEPRVDRASSSTRWSPPPTPIVPGAPGGGCPAAVGPQGGRWWAGPAGWRWAAEGESGVGRCHRRPGGVGSFVRLTANPDQTPIGASFAPAAAAFWAFADRELGTGVGPLSPRSR